MTIDCANELSEAILARFQMIGQFTNNSVGLAYRNVLMFYDDEHGKQVVRDMLRDHRTPVTEVELDRMLMPAAPTMPERPMGPSTEPARGRMIMREQWVKSSCERNGITEEEFFARDEKKAKEGKWEPLRKQWARIDRTIAERKKRGLPVDESGLTAMAPVGPDPFADESPAPLVRSVVPPEDRFEKAKRAAIVADAEKVAREAADNNLDKFFGGLKVVG